MNWLEVQDLHFAYERPIFQGLSFACEEKGLWLCRGRSGLGKSTLGALLAGHLKAGSGTMKLQGRTITGPQPKVLLVSQEDDLFPWLRMRELLEWITTMSEAKTEASLWIEKLRLGQALDLFPHEMSGGMKKRLALLRASLLKPDLLILDETLSSVEPELRDAILEEFVEIWGMEKMGVILMSHDQGLDSQKSIKGVLDLNALTRS